MEVEGRFRVEPGFEVGPGRVMKGKHPPDGEIIRRMSLSHVLNESKGSGSVGSHHSDAGQTDRTSDVHSSELTMEEKLKEKRKEKNREYGRRFRESQKRKLIELEEQIKRMDKSIELAKRKLVEQERVLRRYGWRTDLSTLQEFLQIVIPEEMSMANDRVESIDPFLQAENCLLSRTMRGMLGDDAYDPEEVLLLLYRVAADGRIDSVKRSFVSPEDYSSQLRGRYTWDDLHRHDQQCMKILLSHCAQDPSPSKVLTCAYRRKAPYITESDKFLRIHAVLCSVLDASGKLQGFALAEFFER